MVDFSKRVGHKAKQAVLDPVALYETLDRASDKGPLRPAQEAILADWHANRRTTRDTIVKLHTGQGKTLIGLLLLQSKINETGTPAVYLCPNNFLIKQTCLQAKQFGLKVCTAEPDLPAEFLDGKQILVASVQKLFNGLTKFGIGSNSMQLHSLLMDDSHACIDAIRDCARVRLPHDDSAYADIRALFADSLKAQGMGTYHDIMHGNQDAFLLVPYWEWADKQEEIARILSKSTDREAVKFPWPLLKDRLADCQCVISGAALEIEPYLPPLELFGSFHKAEHRVFMSATVTDDSFLIKGLGLDKATIRGPLIYPKEKWSGEKMVLIPSLIDDKLTRASIVERFGKPDPKRSYGVVALVPSFKGTGDWGKYGATVVDKDTIYTEVERLKAGTYGNALVIANRYDGIDLPDQSCRILVFDSKPYSESLVDNYADDRRTGSDTTAMRVARTIEQGLGRSVRGEKDYCVIILTGTELIKAIRTKELRNHLSDQTRQQVEIGIEIAEFAKEEIAAGTDPKDALTNLINQCLRRDGGWKAFYIEKMDAIVPRAKAGDILEVFELELNAERAFQRGDVQGAVEALQRLLDKYVRDPADRGWYLQEMARYTCAKSKTESNTLQISAHQQNHFLLRPRNGMQLDKLVISQKRMDNIIQWVKQFDNYEQLSIAVDDLLNTLSFGTKADKFEGALDELGQALGFSSQRPDKEWKEGPDNLWGLRDSDYLLFESKDEVSLKRAEINKDETDQMNKSCAWFAKCYEGCKSTNIIIHPTHKVAKSAAFRDPVRVMRERELSAFKSNTRAFFLEFHNLDFRNLSEASVQKFVNAHHLSVDDIQSKYAKDVFKIV